MALTLIILGGLLVDRLWRLGHQRRDEAATPARSACRRSPRAIAEGAQAYLRRQYTTIAIVGVVLFVVVAYLLGMPVAIGFADRRRAVGRRRLHRHERLGARQRPHRPGRDAVASAAASTSPSRPAPSPACWSPASRCSASRVYYGYPDRGIAGSAPAEPHGHRRARRARLRRLADLDLRPSRRRHLHQGRRRRRRPRRQGRGRHSRGRSAQPRDHRRQRRRQCRRLRRHGGRPVRDLCGDRRRHHGARRDLLRRPGRVSTR